MGNCAPTPAEVTTLTEDLVDLDEIFLSLSRSKNLVDDEGMLRQLDKLLLAAKKGINIFPNVLSPPDLANVDLEDDDAAGIEVAFVKDDAFEDHLDLTGGCLSLAQGKQVQLRAAQVILAYTTGGAREEWGGGCTAAEEALSATRRRIVGAS